MPTIEIIDPGEMVQLDPVCSGFAHGFGLFETMRLRGGRLELWEAHWQRLMHSADALGMACPFDRSEALSAVLALAVKISGDAIIKLSLLKAGPSSRLVVYSRPHSVLPEEIGLLIDCSACINEHSPLAGHKTHNYLENLLVLQAARELGCFDGLRLNTQGDVAEGAISNVFFHRDGVLHTPGLETGLLPGVVREILIQSLAVLQGSYRPSDLLSADAVYLTNASIGLQPVDWLLSEGRRIQLQSRHSESYERAQRLLSDHILATAIQV